MSERPAGLLPFPQRSVFELLDVRATQQPDHEALVWRPAGGDRQAWSYSELREAVARAAARLEALGVKPCDRVGIHADNCAGFVITWFALSALGAVMVATNTRSTASELEYYLSRAGCRHIVVERGRAGAGEVVEVAEAVAQSLDAAVVTFDDLLAPDDDVDVPGWSPAAVDPLAAAGIQFTSGTTSRPKGVVWTHANYLWGGKVCALYERLHRTDRHLAFLPLFHTNAQVYSTMATLYAGATLVLMPRFSRRSFWDVALGERATWATMIPFAVKALRGDPVPAHSFRGWGNGVIVPSWDRRFGVATTAWWGMTETVAPGIVSDPGDPAHPLGMGVPSPFYGIRVIDDTGAVVAGRGVGQLEVQGRPGVSMALGYLDDAEADAASHTPDGWFRTGDRVEVHDDGWMSFVERDKDMLKVGGENVAALEIERVLMQVDGVVEAAVVARPDAMLDEVPIAFIVVSEKGDDAEATARAAVARCEGELADFKVPREVRVLPELPRGVLEKVSKAALRDLARQ